MFLLTKLLSLYPFKGWHLVMQMLTGGKMKSGWLPDAYLLWKEDGDPLVEEIHAFLLGEREKGGRREGEGGRERGREGRRKWGGREREREGGREGGREGEREGGRERGREGGMRRSEKAEVRWDLLW